jgi:probable rRNA maturation factor
VTVFLADEQAEPLDAPGIVELADLVLDEEGLPEDTEVSLVFVDVDQITEYNARFMKRAGPTDVLAFPIEDLVPGSPAPVLQDGPPLTLGDVFICPAIVAANAAEGGVPLADEMGLIVVHGILHLLGYGHATDAAAAVMERREQDLLALVGKKRP